MSEELKPCPICELEAILNDWTYNYKYGIECTNCSISNYGWVTEEECIDHWNNLPRLDEKRKAEIALELFNEFDKSVPPVKNFKNDWDRFMNWLDEKAKG